MTLSISTRSPRCPWKTKLSVPGRSTLATALLQGVAQPHKAFSQSPDHHLQSRSVSQRHIVELPLQYDGRQPQIPPRHHHVVEDCLHTRHGNVPVSPEELRPSTAGSPQYDPQASHLYLARLGVSNCEKQPRLEMRCCHDLGGTQKASKQCGMNLRGGGSTCVRAGNHPKGSKSNQSLSTVRPTMSSSTLETDFNGQRLSRAGTGYAAVHSPSAGCPANAPC